MDKTRVEHLAAFGGQALFEKPLPTAQIYAPDREAFMSRLERIVASRRYSNGGPFQQELEDTLATMHQTEHVIAYANASFALVALLTHCSRPDGEDVLVPSFTYRGLPHLIQWSGKMPRFCDVDLDRHTLQAATVESELDRGGVAAILAVNHVNAPADLVGLNRLSRDRDVPLIYDSVYAIAAQIDGQPFGGNGSAEVFSLHATKLVNGFEGGYVTTNDGSLAQTMRTMRNFGYDSVQPEIQMLGMNGKLNEIHAAMALASLESLDSVLARNSEIVDRYRIGLSGIAGLDVVAAADGLVANNEMVLLRVEREFGLGRDEILRVLEPEGALARPYFSPPLHRSVHCPPDVVTGPLPNTDIIEQRFIQLPTGAFVSDADVDRLVELLAWLGEHAPEIRSGLTEQRPPT